MPRGLFHKIVTINAAVSFAYSLTLGKVFAETSRKNLQAKTADMRLVTPDDSLAPFNSSVRYLRERDLIGIQPAPVESLEYLPVVDRSPGLALTGVRRQMEISLKTAAIANAAPGEVVPDGFYGLVKNLETKGVIPERQVGPLLRLNSVLNTAVHSEEVWMRSPTVRRWLLEESPKLFEALWTLLRICPK